MASRALITAALAAGVLSGCARTPADPIDWWHVMPPEPYLTNATQGLEAGEYVIRQFMPWRIRRVCDGNAYACAVMVCFIYTRSDIDEWPEYWAVKTHEAGHCEGWPTDHPGAQPLP